MENLALRIILCTWHMTDGFNRIRSSVDDGEHGGDDPEEEAGHHAAEEGNDNDESINDLLCDLPDGGNVELVHHDVPLIVHDPLRAWHTRHNHSNTVFLANSPLLLINTDKGF